MAKICMVGTGYVGLVSGACFADFGHEVVCVDINPRRIESLERGEIPFYEPGLGELVTRNVEAGRLRFTTELGPAVKASQVMFIGVQTPSAPSGEADLSFVMKVAQQIGRELPADEYKLVVTKSTVPVGTARKVAAVLKEHAKPTARFGVASNPEFLREGSSVEDFMRPDRVVIGVDSQEAEELMRALYRPLYLLDTPIVATTVESAELIKYASNAYLAVKISFINEISNLCEKVGADVNVVARSMGLDKRIGSKFLHAGLGYGGSCLPKDTRAIVHMAGETDESMRIISAAIAVNEERTIRAIEKLEKLTGGLKGKTVGLLGLAFKPNTDDVREAPALRIVPALRERGAIVRGCDPKAEETFLREIGDLEIVKSAYACAEGAHALVLTTEWNPYRELDLEEIKRSMKDPVFLDCRNVYDRPRMEAMGFRYDCFGR